MSSCTPIYQLPYADGADRPCDIDATSCAFADAVERQLDILDDAVASTAGTVPFAYAMSAVQQQVPNSATLTFDTTLVDTNNMVDLGLDNTKIFFPTTGIYNFFVSIEMTVPVGGTQAFLNPILASATGTQFGLNTFTVFVTLTNSATMPAKSNGARLANVAATWEFIANVPTPGCNIRTQLNIGGPAGQISFVDEYRVGALWLRSPL